MLCRKETALEIAKVITNINGEKKVKKEDEEEVR